jgi:hypothetical protein
MGKSAERGTVARISLDVQGEAAVSANPGQGEHTGSPRGAPGGGSDADSDGIASGGVTIDAVPEARAPVGVGRGATVGTPTDAQSAARAALGMPTEVSRHAESGNRHAGGINRHSDCRNRNGQSVSRRADCPISGHRERQSSNRRTRRSIFPTRSAVRLTLSADRRKLPGVVGQESRKFAGRPPWRAARSAPGAALPPWRGRVSVRLERQSARRRECCGRFGPRSKRVGRVLPPGTINRRALGPPVA